MNERSASRPQLPGTDTVQRAKSLRSDWYLRMNLRPRHLQLLAALDELRSVGKVAALLNVTQPAVSKTLAEIQADLGMTLFKRTPRGVEPTDLGSCMARHARAILEEFARTGDELVSLMHGVTGKVAIGAPPSASLVVMPKSVARFKAHSPQTRVVIMEGSADDLVAWLRAGTLDLGVGMLVPKRGLVDVESETLYEEELVVAVGRAYALARKQQPDWKDLADLPWLLPPLNLVLRVFVEDMLCAHDLSIPHNVVESVSVEACIGLLAETDAVTFLPRRVASHFAALGQIAILPLALPAGRSPVSVFWVRSRPLSPAAQTLLACMREVEKERAQR